MASLFFVFKNTNRHTYRVSSRRVCKIVNNVNEDNAELYVTLSQRT